jgi:2-methylfumaryl-CoA isomerase
MVNGVDRPKYGNALYGAFGQDFPTADGRRVMIVALTHRQWIGLLKVTGLGEAAAELGARLGRDLNLEGERFEARRELAALFAPWFAARRVADFAAEFEAAGLTWSEFRSFAGALREDPDLSTDNPMFALVEQPGIGTYPVPGSPFNVASIAREDPRPAPRLGEHSEAILADVLGLGSGQIGALMDAGVVAGPKP